jgi:hypothetical protein
MFTPFEQANMDSLITAGKSLDISHANMHSKASYKTKDGVTVVMNYSSVIDKYYDYLQKIIVDYEMTDEEYMNYRFQPKRMCMELYGTTEIWSSLLRINNMGSASQFTKQTIKAFTEDIIEVINEIMILEEEEMRDNRIAIYGK